MKYPPVHYHHYLQLDKLLDAQQLKSEEYGRPAHDELLFITVHQAYELWFKQILFELDSILEVMSQDKVDDKKMGLVQHRLHRIISIIRLVLGQIDVLETMTPLDFLDFREFLYPASGFQSSQFRLIETKLGLRDEDRLNYNQGPFYKHLEGKAQEEVKKALQNKNLFTAIEAWLERTPVLKTKDFDFWTTYKAAVDKMLNDDISVIKSIDRLTTEEKEKNIKMLEASRLNFAALFEENSYKELQKAHNVRLSFKALQAALMISVYRDEPLFQIPYSIIQSLLDIDELLTQWRYRHALMAHRMLGKKIGTGGSSGHDYLKSATEKHKIFSDFFNLATFLIPRSQVPELPKELRAHTQFNYE